MQRVQTSEEAHTRALTNQNSLATDAIKTASQADGTEVSTTAPFTGATGAAA